MELQLQLDQMVDEGSGGFRQQIWNLQKQLDRRFDHYNKVDSTEFSPVFIVATFLDPRYKSLLSDSQINITTKLIMQKLENNSPVQSQCPDSGNNNGENPPASKKLMLVDQLLQRKQSGITSQPSTILMEELKAYALEKLVITDKDAFDPIAYWVSKKQCFNSGLPLFACRYLTVPVSTSFVKSIFSYAGFASFKLRNSISDENLEREVFLKMNI